MKLLYGFDLKVGHKVKNWEDATILSIDPIEPPPSAVISFRTDKGKYCCGILAELSVYEDNDHA
jgi:hypothetical protein